MAMGFCIIVQILHISGVFMSILAPIMAADRPNMTSGDLIKNADSLFGSGNYETARELFFEALEAANREDNRSNAAEANAMIARSYLIMGDGEAGMPFLKKAEQTAAPEMPEAWSRYLGVRGRFEWQNKELSRATETFKEMYEFCRVSGLTERAIDAAHMVAITSPSDGQIEWGLKGIAEAEKADVTSWLGPLWNNLGATYEEQKKYPEAVDAYLKAREYHWRYGTEQNKLIADWAVGHAYLLNGDIQRAWQWLRPVLAWAKRIDNNEFIGLSLRDLAEVYAAAGDEKSALEYFIRAEEYLKKADMPEWDAAGYKQLVDKITALKADAR